MVNKDVSDGMTEMNPAALTPDRVYFPFFSGRLTYDCAKCNATCCRGHGYALHRTREAPDHLRLRRNLHVFVDSSGVDAGYASLHVGNCPPACFFLTETGQCRIELDHGHNAKPQTCRLFPFNHFRRIGDHLIVAPHPTLCPLSVTDADVIDRKSRHEDLMSEMRLTGVSGRLPEYRPPRSHSVGELLRLERAIVERSVFHETDADYFRFAAVQYEMWRNPDLELTAASFPESVKMFRGYAKDVARLLGASEGDLDESASSLVKTMAIVTPYFRLEFLLPVNVSARSARHILVDPERLSFTLVGLYVIAMLARSAGMSPVTIQTLSRLTRTFRPLLSLLSYRDAPLVWRSGTLLRMPAGITDELISRALGVARALLPRNQMHSPRGIGEILMEYCPSDAVDRTRFLGLVTRSIFGKVAPLGQDIDGHPGAVQRMKSVTQKAALMYADDELLVRWLQREAKRRSNEKLPVPERT